MELSRLLSLLAFVGALNIFYEVCGLTRMSWVYALIPTVAYLVLMYSSAIVDGISGEMARDGGMDGIRLQASDLVREVRAN